MDVFRTQRHMTCQGELWKRSQAGLAKASELGVDATIAVTDRVSGELVALGGTRVRTRGHGGGRWARPRWRRGLAIPPREFLDKRLKQDEVLWRAIELQPRHVHRPREGVPACQRDAQ